MSYLWESGEGYDTREKEWRHLNFFQYACYLEIDSNKRIKDQSKAQ